MRHLRQRSSPRPSVTCVAFRAVVGGQVVVTKARSAEGDAAFERALYELCEAEGNDYVERDQEIIVLALDSNTGKVLRASTGSEMDHVIASYEETVRAEWEGLKRQN